MSGKTRKESILSVYYMLNKCILEQALRIPLQEVEIEKNIGNRRVDLFAQNKENSQQIFIELQLTQTDNIHLEQIIKLIESKEVGNNIVLGWIATDFKTQDIDCVLKVLNKTSKCIEFVALQLNTEILPIVQELDNLGLLNIMQKVNRLDSIKNHMHVIQRYYKNKEVALQPTVSSETLTIVTHKEKILKYVIEEMRKQLWYYLPVHRTKQVAGNKITLGAGTQDIVYNVGINKYNYLYVTIKCAGSKAAIYNKWLTEKEDIDANLGYRLEWDNKNLKIDTHIYLRDNYKRQIKEVTHVLDQYIQCFSKRLSL